MQDLTNREAIKAIDPQDTYASTDLAPKQMEEAWKQVQAIEVPQDFGQVTNIVFCGMGASIYGALVIKALLGPNFKYPVEVVSDYHLPVFVNENTLVVLTSYSGTTEEVLSCAEEAKAKNAKMLVLTKGGALSEFAKTNSVPSYIFDGALNPAGVPRLGNGYTILGLIGLLYKAGIVDLDENEIVAAIERLKGKVEGIKAKAMTDSEKFYDKIPVVFAAEHLSGNAQIIRNQFNETSKAFSAYYLIPDLNHHLMEGLQFPKESKLLFTVFQSKNYTEKNHLRVVLTTDVVKQNNQEVYEYDLQGETVYDDFLEMLTFGSYLTLFLALRYDQNPAVNPWVDWFKDQLKK